MKEGASAQPNLVTRRIAKLVEEPVANALATRRKLCFTERGASRRASQVRECRRNVSRAEPHGLSPSFLCFACGLCQEQLRISLRVEPDANLRVVEVERLVDGFAVRGDSQHA